MNQLSRILFILIFSSLSFNVFSSNGKNAIIFSFCSVNSRMLPEFGDVDKNDYPNMASIFGKSILLKNAYNDLSWSNIKKTFYSKHWHEKYRPNHKINNLNIQDWEGGDKSLMFYRIPGKEDSFNPIQDYFDDSRLDEAFTKIPDILSEFDKRIAKNKNNNVFIVHFKLMHYPYLNQKFLKQEVLEKIYNKDELLLLNSYLTNPQTYPDKLAFFQVLFGEKKYEKIFLNKQGKFVSYANSQFDIDKWQNSKNFDKDIILLKKAYLFRLRKMDKLIGELTNIFEKKYKENSILIFAGDHGESFMQHSNVIHGGVPYDEILKFFAAIYVPSNPSKVEINDQITTRTFKGIVEEVINNKFNLNRIVKIPINNPSESILISYSCDGTSMSARKDNKWKLIYRIKENRYELYDLTNDPNETKNIYSFSVPIVGELKAEILTSMDHVSIGNKECVQLRN